MDDTKITKRPWMDEDHSNWHSKWDANWVYKQDGDSTGRNEASWNRRWQDRLQERVDRLSIDREDLRKRLDARREVGAYLEVRLRAATKEVEELRRNTGTRGREAQTKLERSKADESLGVAVGAKTAEEVKAAAREKVADERGTADRKAENKTAARMKPCLGESYESRLKRARVAAQTKDLETKDEDFRRQVTRTTCRWKIKVEEAANKVNKKTLEVNETAAAPDIAGVAFLEGRRLLCSLPREKAGEEPISAADGEQGANEKANVAKTAEDNKAAEEARKAKAAAAAVTGKAADESKKARAAERKAAEEARKATANAKAAEEIRKAKEAKARAATAAAEVKTAEEARKVKAAVEEREAAEVARKAKAGAAETKTAERKLKAAPAAEAATAALAAAAAAMEESLFLEERRLPCSVPRDGAREGPDFNGQTGPRRLLMTWL